MDLTIFNGAPDSNIGRLDKEMDFYRLLSALDVPFSRIDHGAAFTMEECYAADSAFGVMACKNLFLCNRQQTDFYLLLMPGDKPFKTKELSAQINTSRLSFASSEHMERYLNISPGAVSAAGLMNDTDLAVNLLVDEDLLKSENIVIHPCVNTSSVMLRTADLFEKFVPYTKHGYKTVKLVGE